MAPPTGVWVEPSSAGTSVTVASTRWLAGQSSVGNDVVVELDVDVEVDDVLDVELEVVLDVEDELLVLDDVDVETDSMVVVVVEDELDVVVDDVVEVLHCGGGAPTSSGTPTTSAQSLSNDVTQSTQSTTSCVLETVLPQPGPANGSTPGHCATNPMSLGGTAPTTSHPSFPPHARQIRVTFCRSAL